MIAILSSCGKMKAPEFRRIQGFELAALGLMKSELKLQITYFNPNKFAGSLKWAEGDAWIDSLYMGPFKVDTTITANPQSEFEVPVTLMMDMMQAVKLTNSLRKKGFNPEVWLKIEGKARAGRNGLYKTVPLKFEGLQKLEF